MESYTRDEFMRLFGDIAMKFSNLEFMVRQLLIRLLGPPPSIAGCVMTDRMIFDQMIQKVRQMVRLSSDIGKNTRDYIEATMKQVDHIRQQRNAFIHGQWEMNDGCLQRGIVRCIQSRLKPVMSQDNSSTEFITVKEYPLVNLEQLSDEVGSLVVQLVRLLDNKHPE